MKKKVLKKWVITLLEVVDILAVLFMCADYESMAMFHQVHLVAFLVFALSTTLIFTFGKKDIFE